MRRDLDSKFSVGLPYPQIRVDGKNERYAKLIMLNHAGMVSEFTAVTQYVYHETVLMQENPVISDALKGIAMVEMHHLQILGELIVLLGGDPRYMIYKKKTPALWSPKFVEYGNTPKSALIQDIEGEKEAIAQYESTINQIDDENIIAIIKRIILDEEFHLKILTELYQKYVK